MATYQFESFLKCPIYHGFGKSTSKRKIFNNFTVDTFETAYKRYLRCRDAAKWEANLISISNENKLLYSTVSGINNKEIDIKPFINKHYITDEIAFSMLKMEMAYAVKCIKGYNIKMFKLYDLNDNLIGYCNNVSPLKPEVISPYLIGVNYHITN